MKITAYICDNCEGIFLDRDTVGLLDKPKELFIDEQNQSERLSAGRQGYCYTATNNHDRTNVHLCLGCIRKYVYDLVKGIDRSKQEADYQFHYHLYMKKLYENVKNKTILRSHSGNRRSEKLLQPLGKASRRK